MKNILTDINLYQNAVSNAVLNPAVDLPLSGKVGQVIVLTVDSNQNPRKGITATLMLCTTEYTGAANADAAASSWIAVGYLSVAEARTYNEDGTTEDAGKLGGIIPGKGLKISAEGVVDVVNDEMIAGAAKKLAETITLKVQDAGTKIDTTTQKKVTDGTTANAQLFDGSIETNLNSELNGDGTHQSYTISLKTTDLFEQKLDQIEMNEDDIATLKARVDNLSSIRFETKYTTLADLEAATDKSENCIYLIPLEKQDEDGHNIYEEYVFISEKDAEGNITSNGKLELIGTTRADLDGYLKKDTAVEFIEAAATANLATKDSIETVFGKIQKIFSQLLEKSYYTYTNGIINLALVDGTTSYLGTLTIAADSDLTMCQAWTSEGGTMTEAVIETKYTTAADGSKTYTFTSVGAAAIVTYTIRKEETLLS